MLSTSALFASATLIYTAHSATGLRFPDLFFCCSCSTKPALDVYCQLTALAQLLLSYYHPGHPRQLLYSFFVVCSCFCLLYMLFLHWSSVKCSLFGQASPVIHILLILSPSMVNSLLKDSIFWVSQLSWALLLRSAAFYRITPTSSLNKPKSALLKSRVCPLFWLPHSPPDLEHRRSMDTRVKAAIDPINKPHHLRWWHSKRWGTQSYNTHRRDHSCKAEVPGLKTLAEEGSLCSRNSVYFLFLPKKCKKWQRLYGVYGWISLFRGIYISFYKIQLSVLTCHINTFILYRIGHWGILKLCSYPLSFKCPAMTTVPVSYEFRGSCLFLYASLSFSTLLSLKL